MGNGNRQLEGMVGSPTNKCDGHRGNMHKTLGLAVGGTFATTPKPSFGIASGNRRTRRDWMDSGGPWSKKWMDIQERYYKNNRIRWTGRRWLTALIKKLWLVAWDFWEHQNGINQENQEALQQLANQDTIRDEYGQGSIGLKGFD